MGAVKALFVALVLIAAMAVPAQAVEAEKWAFVYVDHPKATRTYTPVNQSGSAPGIQAQVTNRGQGVYDVLIKGGAASGVPIVTAVSDTRANCELILFRAQGSDEFIQVSCRPAASRFTLTFFSSSPPDSGASGAYGYVFDDQPSLDTYANPPSYNSTGGRVEIYHTAGTRIWTARFFGTPFDNLAGNVQVSALGTARCAVSQWDPHTLGVDAQVRCDGPDNPQWTLVYAHNRSIVGGVSGFFGYLQANEPDSAFYTPDLNRNRAPNGFTHTVTRSGPGQYQAQVYGPLKAPVALHVSVNGNTDASCNLVRWTVNPNTQPAGLVDISCFDAAGVPADNWFSLNYYSPG